MSVAVPPALLALRPTARAFPARFFVGAALAALVAALVLRDAPGGALLASGFFLAAGASPVLDDRATATLDPSPTPRWVRRGLRLALVLPVLAGCWLVLLAAVRLLAPPTSSVPVAVATWRWVGMVAVVLIMACAAQALAAPVLDGSAGVAGLLAAVLGDALVQNVWPKVGVFMLAEPTASTTLRLRITALVVVAVVILVVSTRDRARRRPRWWRTRQMQAPAAFDHSNWTCSRRASGRWSLGLAGRTAIARRGLLDDRQLGAGTDGGGDHDVTKRRYGRRRSGVGVVDGARR